MSEPYRVPKRRVRAEVTLPGKPAAKVELFLSETALAHSGAERPSDLFNGNDRFIPAADSHGRMIFLQRDAVLVVTVRAEDEFAGDALLAMALRSEQAIQARLEVALEDGSTVQGTSAYLMPDGQRRLQDYLNSADRFLVLLDEDQVRLVNKRRVARISPL